MPQVIVFYLMAGALTQTRDRAMSEVISDWWDDLLKDREKQGEIDAQNGVFEYPYSDDSDPQNQDENLAYKRGFTKKRNELGESFKWK